MSWVSAQRLAFGGISERILNVNIVGNLPGPEKQDAREEEIKKHNSMKGIGMKTQLICLLLIAVTGFVLAQERTEFIGIPQTKINEGGISRIADNVSKVKAAQFKCIIKTDGEKYFWVSRENKEMTKVVSGAFVTYMAIDASGFVRIILPEYKKATSIMGEAEATYDYVEHLLLGLKSVTYYGTAQ